jgi:hypothetical protein
MHSLLVVLVCVLIVALELLLVVAMFAAQAVLRPLRRLLPKARSASA